MDYTPVLLPPEPFRVNRGIWYAITAIGACDALWLRAAGIRLDVAPVGTVSFVLAGCVALSAFYRYVRRDDMLYLLGHIVNQLIGIVGVLGILSYLSARLDFPLVDDRLIKIDRLVAFDWRAYVAWVDSQPILARLLTFAYVSSGPQIFILTMALFFCKHMAHIQRFLIAFLISGLLVTVLAAIFPAVGGYVYFNIDVTQFRHLQPAAARLHEHLLLGLRDHSIGVLSFPIEGLVTFPSFHSTMAVLMIYAGWPMRRFRIMVIPLNLLVLMSTPGDGGHYLTDILGGIAAAIAAIKIAQLCVPPVRILLPTKPEASL